MTNKNTKKKLFIVTIVILVYILFMTTGYALFQESLTIHGVANTVDYYSGTKLPHTAVKLDTNRDLYYTSNYDEGYSYATNSWRFIYGYSNALVNESWNDNIYTITFDKKMLGAFQNKQITYTISFSNPTVLDYTNGNVVTTYGNTISGYNVSTASGTANDVSSASTALTSTSIAPNGSVSVTMTTQLGTYNKNVDTVFQAKIGYQLYSGNNGMRYFYFRVVYDADVVVNNLIDENLMVSAFSNVTLENNGYHMPNYPVSYTTTNAGSAFVNDLKSKLEAGATYRFIRDYQGEERASSGRVRLNDSTNNIADTPVSTGLRYTDFTLTQEQIDSIQRVYVYGPGPDYQNNLFTFIRIVKISQ